jgi:dethiobiotin synthetase
VLDDVREKFPNIIFVTGTDTGVGKTVLTGLLVRYLRETGWDARAMKPFCSGSRDDARLLRRAQNNLLTLDEINPFYIAQPLAPAAAGGRKNIRLEDVVRKIRAAAARCEVLLVEGIGGLLVPLTENDTVRDLIVRLDGPVIVVGWNRLGTINHTLLTVRELESAGMERVMVVLMSEKRADKSARSNPKMIRKMLPKTPVFVLPDLGKGAITKINVKFMKKSLARLMGDDILAAFFREKEDKSFQRKTLTTGFKSIRYLKLNKVSEMPS